MPSEAEIKELEPSPWRKECIADVIRILEDQLDKAKKGEISSVAIAMTVPGKCSGTIFSKTDDLSSLIGAISVLNYRLCKDSEE